MLWATVSTVYLPWAALSLVWLCLLLRHTLYLWFDPILPLRPPPLLQSPTPPLMHRDLDSSSLSSGSEPLTLACSLASMSPWVLPVLPYMHHFPHAWGQELR